MTATEKRKLRKVVDKILGSKEVPYTDFFGGISTGKEITEEEYKIIEPYLMELYTCKFHGTDSTLQITGRITTSITRTNGRAYLNFYEFGEAMFKELTDYRLASGRKTYKEN